MDQSSFEDFCNQPPPQSISVGILAKETETQVIIFQTIGDNAVAEVAKINRESLISMEEIGEVECSLVLG